MHPTHDPWRMMRVLWYTNLFILYNMHAPHIVPCISCVARSVHAASPASSRSPSDARMSEVPRCPGWVKHYSARTSRHYYTNGETVQWQPPVPAEQHTSNLQDAPDTGAGKHVTQDAVVQRSSRTRTRAAKRQRSVTGAPSPSTGRTRRSARTSVQPGDVVCVTVCGHAIVSVCCLVKGTKIILACDNGMCVQTTKSNVRPVTREAQTVSNSLLYGCASWDRRTGHDSPGATGCKMMSRPLEGNVRNDRGAQRARSEQWELRHTSELRDSSRYDAQCRTRDERKTDASDGPRGWGFEPCREGARDKTAHREHRAECRRRPSRGQQYSPDGGYSRPREPARASGWNAAGHYNDRAGALGRVGKRQREEEPSFGTRAWNNFCKAVLLEAAMSVFPPEEPLNILDLCVGRGADIHKLREAARVHMQRIGVLVGVDVAEKALEHCKERADIMSKSTRWCDDARFVHADLADPSNHWLREAHKTAPSFHIVTSQLALHYFCRSPQCLNTFFESAAVNMAEKSLLVLSYTSGDDIVRQARRALQRDCGPAQDCMDSAHDVAFGTEQVRIRVPAETMQRLQCAPAPSQHGVEGADGGGDQDVTGLRVYFSIGTVIRDSEEYIVDEATVEAAANRAGLKRVLGCGFRDIVAGVAASGHAFEPLLQQIRAPYRSGRVLEQDLWDSIRFYRAAVYVKTDGDVPDGMCDWVRNYMLGQRS